MAEIDSLEIQITASSRAASVALDNLNDKLKTLAGRLNFRASGLEALDNINGTNIRNLGIGLSALGKGLKSIQGIQRIDFGKVARDVKKLANIPAGNLATLGNAMKPLADGINALSKAKIDNSNLTNLINSLTRLSNANLGNLDGTNFTRLGTSIKEFANAVSGADKVEQSTIAMTNAIAKLAAAGKNIGKVTGALPHLANSLKGFMNTMSRAPQVSNEITTFTQAVGTLANAGDKAKATAGNLGKLADELKNFMQTMSTAPNVSDSVIRMTDALSRLSGQGGRVSVSTNSLSSSFSRTFNLSGKLGASFKKLSGAMSGLSGVAKNASGNFKGFLRQLMSATGVYFSIYGAIRGLKSAIDISSDLTEVQNVVDVAFGDMAYKMEDFTKNSVKDFGMSELTAKQIGGRYQAMAAAIGVSADKIGQANTFLKGQTKGYVDASDSMADVSVNLTKLAADMASFYNVEQTDVAKSLESIFTGTTAPLRRYGIDLTQATLSEWAMKQGLDADIKSMSQAEKTMLRYQYVLANTTAAQGDFARTADSWANQTRVLVQQLEILGSVVGGVLINAFKPLVKALNAVMTKVISFAKTVADALGTIFGWTFEVNPGGMTNDFGDMSSGIEDVADSAGDAKDNLKDTNKEAKDLKENLQDFDKLHVISLDKDKDKDKDGGKGKDKDKGAGIGGIGGLDTALKETDTIFKKYKSKIDTLYKLGDYIGKTLTDALNSINWDKVYAAADNFGIGLAQFLNGLISPELFEAVGNTIAGALNTALHALDNFGATFDWKNLGDSLSSGLIAFLKGIDWKRALSAAANWGAGIATTLNSFISPESFGLIGESVAKAINVALKFLDNFGTTFRWNNFGKSLGTGLNKFLKGLNWKSYLKDAKTFGKGIAKAINAFLNETDFKVVGESVAQFLNGAIVFAVSSGKTIQFKTIGKKIADGLNGFFKKLKTKELADSINVWVKGALTTVATLLKKTDFEAIGKKIGQFLAELDLTGMIAGFAKVLNGAINGAMKLFANSFSAAPIETALLTAFAVLKFPKIGPLISSKLLSSMKTAGRSALEKFSSFFNGGLAGVIGTGIAGFAEFSIISDAFEKLTSETGNFIEEIGKIGATATVAAGIMYAALGPAGIAIAAITGVVAAIKGINDALEEINAELAGERIYSALSTPNGTPINKLTESISESIRNIGRDFSSLSEKSNDLDSARKNIGDIKSQIELVEEKLKAGTITAEEAKESFINLLNELNAAVKSKFGALNSYIVSAFGDGGVWSESFESAGVDVSEMIGKTLGLTGELQTRFSEITERLSKLDPTSPKYKELQAEMYGIIGQTDSMELALTNFSQKVSSMEIDYSGLIAEDGELDSGAVESVMEEISSAVNDTKKEVDDAGSEMQKSLTELFNAAKAEGNEEAVEYYGKILKKLPDVIRNRKKEVALEGKELTDTLQTGLVDRIKKVGEDAHAAWDNMTSTEKTATGMPNATAYADEMIRQYTEKVIIPFSDSVEKNFKVLGIEGAGWSGQAAKDASDAFTNYDWFGNFEENVSTENVSTVLKEVVSNATKDVDGYAKEETKTIGKAITDGLSLGIDVLKAAKSGEDIGDALLKSFKNNMGIHSPSTVMKEQGGYLMQGLINGINGMKKNVTSSFSDIKNNITKTWDEAKKKTTDVWATISGKVNETWGNMKTQASEKFSNIKKSVSDAWENVKTSTSNTWDTASSKVSEVWGNIKKWAADKFDSAKKSITDAWEEARKKTNGVWGEGGVAKTISGTFDKIKGWAADKFVNAKDSIQKSITSAWSEIKKKTKSVWENKDGVTKMLSNAWKNIKDSVSGALDGKEGIIKKMSGAWDSIKKTSESAWKQIAESILSPIKKAVNGVIIGINWVLEKVGSKKKLDLWDAKGYAKGSDGIPQDTLGVVNDQKGSTYRELIVPPHGKPFIPKGRNVMLPLEKGTKIMPAMETKRFISGLPRFEGGIGDFIGGAWERVKNFTGQIWDYITEPKKIVQIAIDKFTNMAGVLEPMLSIAKGAVTTIADGATNFVKKVFDEELKVDYKVGAGVQQWAGLAVKALQITGQYTPANLSYLLQQMQHESSGNPNAINLWDSNAKKGTPSKGLMQVIDPTFRANAMPPYNKNIYDPLSNMIAAIRYTVKRYGSLYKGWAARGFKGYAQGIGKITLSDVIHGYANGGFPSSGQLFMARENGIPEMVGKIGSRTAVANNDQITEAFSKSISRKLDETSNKFEDIMRSLASAIQKSFDKAGKQNGTDQKVIEKASKQAILELDKAMSGMEKEFLSTGEISGAETRNLLSGIKQIIYDTKSANKESFNALKSVYGSIESSANKTFGQLENLAKSYNSFFNTESAKASASIKEENERNEETRTVNLQIETEIDADASEAGQNFVSGFSEGMKNYISGMEDWVNQMRETAVNGFSGIAGDVQIYGGETVLSYADGIYENYDQLDEAVDGMAADLADGFSGAEYEVQVDGGNIITGLTNGMSEKWEELMTWAQSARDELGKIFTFMGEDAYQSGAGIVAGLLEGINSMWESITETVNKIKATFQSVQKMVSKIEQAGTKTTKIKVSDATEEKIKKSANYKPADMTGKGKAASTKTVEGKFTKAKAVPVEDSFSKDLVNGVSIGVADAVNKILVPALENERNLNVSLKGDAGKIFSVVQEKAQKYKTITGNAAF